MGNTVEIWAKPLPGKKVAILILNTVEANVTVTLSVADDVPGKPQGKAMRDVWNHEDVPIPSGKVRRSLRTHDSVLAVLEETSDSLAWGDSVRSHVSDASLNLAL